MLPDTYKTIESPIIAEFKDRGSRFIAYAHPIATITDVDVILQNYKALHPKAVHYCYAYRLDFDKTIWRTNDDGEPSGSAGRPILGQIDSFQLTNVIIVVVRYFGGILLGVPGLIHAYKTASRLALEEATIIQKSIEMRIKIRCNYELHFKVLNWLKRQHLAFEIVITDKEVVIQTAVPISLLHVLEVEVKEFAIIEVS